jgi:hypothetical protein
MERKDVTSMLRLGTVALFNLVSRRQKRAFSELGGNMNKTKETKVTSQARTEVSVSNRVLHVGKANEIHE